MTEIGPTADTPIGQRFRLQSVLKRSSPHAARRTAPSRRRDPWPSRKQRFGTVAPLQWQIQASSATGDLGHKRAFVKKAAIAFFTFPSIWHSTRSMTHHYSVAQIVELHSAQEQIKDDSGRWNKSLAMLKLEQKGQTAGASPAKVPHEGKTAYGTKRKPLM